MSLSSECWLLGTVSEPRAAVMNGITRAGVRRVASLMREYFIAGKVIRGDEGDFNRQFIFRPSGAAHSLRRATEEEGIKARPRSR